MGVGARLPDFGEDPNVRVKEVAPGSSDDPFKGQSDPAQTPASPPPSGTGDAPPASPVGTPTGTDAATPPTPSTPEPRSQAPAETPPAAPPPAPPQPEPGQPVTLPAPTTPEPTTQTPPASAELPQMTDEQYTEARKQIEEEVEGKWRARQGGMDRRMSEMQQESTELKEQVATHEQALFEARIAGLPKEEQERARALNAVDLERKEVEGIKKETLAYGEEVEIGHLLLEYGKVEGVTQEALQEVPVDEREAWCLQKENEALKRQLSSGQPATSAPPNGVPVETQGTVPPAQPAPAGASAPSDISGAGVPPATPKPNEGQGYDAMADNIAGFGWERARVPTRRDRQ